MSIYNRSVDFLNLLNPRCELYFQDIKTFIEMSEAVKECITLDLENKKNEEAINVLNRTI